MTCGAIATCATACAAGDGSDAGRVTVIEENDAFALPPTDRWYTQGAEVHYLSSASTGTSRLPLLDALAPTDASVSTARRFDLLLGQEMFTPVNLSQLPPDPKDRPYAGWLYAGVGVLQESDHRDLGHFELLLGMVGPAALGAQTQDAFHGSTGQVQPRGWEYQLRNEPGVVASYERKWRLTLIDGSAIGIEAIPELGASAGNVYTYAEASVLLRIGQSLRADYGPLRMRPAPSGSAWFDPNQLRSALSWSVFVGAQGRAVARNIFLDGNTWQKSASVDKNVMVGDLTAGLSLLYSSRFRLDAAWVWRSKEFTDQSVDDRFGGFNLSFAL